MTLYLVIDVYTDQIVKVAYGLQGAQSWISDHDESDTTTTCRYHIVAVPAEMQPIREEYKQ